MNRLGLLAAGAIALMAMGGAGSLLAQSPTVDRYTVYCADNRIEISFWDLEQMKVRRGSNVCPFASYTSYSDALTFAQKNFGGEGKACSC